MRSTPLQLLGTLLKAFRESRSLTQDALAQAEGVKVSRSTIALLEQGRRAPEPQILRAICEFLNVPPASWEPLVERTGSMLEEFEEILSELVGQEVSLGSLDPQTSMAAETQIRRLHSNDLTREQAYDALNSALVYYGVRPMGRPFFDEYFDADSLRTNAAFRKAVLKYQSVAIRLFSTFAEAYARLSQTQRLREELSPLDVRKDDAYRGRTDWNSIVSVEESRLPHLGYIAASQIRQEETDRLFLSVSLLSLAEGIRREGRLALTKLSERDLRRIDSLLRKFHSSLSHGPFSPLFSPDPDQLEREAASLAPKDSELAQMEETQAIAQRNLANYLAADHLDVYVATSMRDRADFVSVNRFVGQLFRHDFIRPLKLRYFNPTQSWISDRVAKGLVEALMLKRADFAIYMAQKEDSFGKDSEASVALGQGKPVIVYVPKLVISDLDIDTEKLGSTEIKDLRRLLTHEDVDGTRDLDESSDQEALHSRLLTVRLRRASDIVISNAVREHWADFGLYQEAERLVRAARVESSLRASEVRDDARDEKISSLYRKWLDDVIVRRNVEGVIPSEIRDGVIGVLVAMALRFEGRARIFRAIHPLALQVILSSGVLNGILVARSVDACAFLLRALIRNELSLELISDDDNYKLVETTTRSVIRVISKHQMLRNAFGAFYSRP